MRTRRIAVALAALSSLLGLIAPAASAATANQVASHLTPEPAFQLRLLNAYGEELDEVAVFYALSSGSIIGPVSIHRFPANEVRVLDLGPCSQVRSYAIGAYEGAREVWSSGLVYPISSDGDLCADTWALFRSS